MSKNDKKCQKKKANNDEKYSQNSERSPQAGENKSKSTKMLESSPQVRESDKKLMHKRAQGASRLKKKSTTHRLGLFEH